MTDKRAVKCYLDQDVAETLEVVAAVEGKTISALVAEAAEDLVDRRRKSKTFSKKVDDFRAQLERLNGE